MWIFTDTGFISIVRKPEHPGVLTVRARDRHSLELLAAKAGVEIKRSPHGDYPYRVFVGDAEFNVVEGAAPPCSGAAMSTPKASPAFSYSAVAPTSTWHRV